LILLRCLLKCASQFAVVPVQGWCCLAAWGKGRDVAAQPPLEGIVGRAACYRCSPISGGGVKLWLEPIARSIIVRLWSSVSFELSQSLSAGGTNSRLF
jgi:hypothetical protein